MNQVLRNPRVNINTILPRKTIKDALYQLVQALLQLYIVFDVDNLLFDQFDSMKDLFSNYLKIFVKLLFFG